MLLTQHRKLTLDSGSLSKVQDISYFLRGERENVIVVYSKLNYTGSS
jgi:hypothetical protein